MLLYRCGEHVAHHNTRVKAMLITNLKKDDVVTFYYKGITNEQRIVRIDTIKCDNTLIVGTDELRDGKFRSFNIKYITGLKLA